MSREDEGLSWGEVGSELDLENAKPINDNTATGVRAKHSATIPMGPGIELKRNHLVEVVTVTRPYSIGSTNQKIVGENNGQNQTTREVRTTLRGITTDDLPMTDDTPVFGLTHTLAEATRADRVLHTVNNSIPPAVYYNALRANTVEVHPNSLPLHSAHRSSQPPANHNDEPEAELTLAETEEDIVVALDDFDAHEAFDLVTVPARETNGIRSYTILPPPNTLKLGPPIRPVGNDLISTMLIGDKAVEEIVKMGTEARLKYAPLEHRAEISFFESAKNFFKTAANKISDVVRSSIDSIFSFRRTMRQSFAAILLAAGLNAIASSQGSPVPQTQANEPAPISVQTVSSIETQVVDSDITPTPTGTTAETPAAHSTFSKTITVSNGHSPHVTFVQALTEFLTDNGTRAALPAGYQHRHGDAIRILHQLERGPQHDTANHLRYLTHSGDRFSFSVMSDGTISLGNWQNRHTDNNKLPEPITFGLPAHL